MKRARNTLRNIIIGASMILPSLFANPTFAQEKPFQDDKKIVTGYVEKPEFGKRISIEYVKEQARMKSGNDRWYGDQVVMPDARPDIKGEGNLDWHGSGDVDKNGIRTSEDKILGSGAYEADIDGDGVPGTQNDQTIFSDYLKGFISYLPGDWEKLRKGEKISWLEKMISIDKADTFVDGWLCGEYDMQFLLNFNGLEKAEDYQYHQELEEKYNLSKTNAKFNLPVYSVATVTEEGVGHRINAIFIGHDDPSKNDPTDFGQYYFIEPQTDERVFPGNFSMNKEEYAKLERLCYNKFGGEANFGIMPVIHYNLTNGIPTKTFEHPHLRLKQNSSGILTFDNWEEQKGFIKNIFPNPISNGNLNVVYGMNNGNVRYNITNMLGQVVKQGMDKNFDGNNTIEIPHHELRAAAGMYFANLVDSKGQVYSKRFVKN